jgi:hypothetical protein
MNHPHPCNLPASFLILSQALRASAEFLGRNSVELRRSTDTSPSHLKSSSSSRANPPSDESFRPHYQSHDSKAAFFVPPALADVIAARAPSDLLRINNTGPLPRRTLNPFIFLMPHCRRRRRDDASECPQHFSGAVRATIVGDQRDEGGEAANRYSTTAHTRVLSSSSSSSSSAAAATTTASLNVSSQVV